MSDFKLTTNCTTPGTLLPLEIFRLIAGSCGKKDTSNLAKICQSLFNLLVPVLWKVLDRPEKILGLIPGAKVNRINLETVANNNPKIRVEIVSFCNRHPYGTTCVRPQYE
ncbi:hypothetical protein B0J17DRAFT_631122 [Rhizoctonia solani]|nr:hypothetical protein B0J17DRAFT_631122 [Rhizoctonia solani]